MFCVIQEVKTKTASKGEPKGIEVYESHWSVDGKDYCSFGWKYSEERFECPVRKSYRISIHESHRENGKVKKRQTVICTVRYYDVVDYGADIDDYVLGGLESKADVLGISADKLSDMIYKKWNPIADKILLDFKQTEEYKTREENRRIINEHNQRVDVFTKKYGVDRYEYDYCYDVFGELRNSEYLKKIEADCEVRKEYERRSQEQSRSYYEKFYSNYGGREGGYCGSVSGICSEENKAILKKFYRTLSKAFHPDSNPDKDTSEEMKMLNQLKGEWGV